MKIAIACDHGASDLKNAVMKHLHDLGYETLDFGTYTKGRQLAAGNI